jgi:outer membrane protein assembly factor BamD
MRALPLRTDRDVTGTAPAMLENRLYRLLVLLVLAGGAVGCARGFRVARYTTNEALYQAATEQYARRKWGNAITAFERLTLDLPSRDTLAPLAHWFLAKSYAAQRDHLLAAQAFNRFAESFATDSLADNAMFEAGLAYRRLWRRCSLDANYGEQAMSTFQGMLGLYPDSELLDAANREVGNLQECFAEKDYENGLYYFRRKAFDSAIIYFKDVVKDYPQTAKSREAYLRLAESYEAIRYREDKLEVCTALKERYPTDQEVGRVCGRSVAVSQRPKPDSTTPPDTR